MHPEPKVQLRKAVQLLGTAAERPRTVPRGAFGDWTDADYDGCDTRAEVLKHEAVAEVTVGADCTIESGQWYSWPDDQPVTGPPAGRIDVVPLVPLAEAWASGAHAWDARQRVAFANDLGAEATLTAVSAQSARQRAERDPATWLPVYLPSRCAYVADWVTTKLRWDLSVDFAEAVKLTEIAQGCPNVPLRINYR